MTMVWLHLLGLLMDFWTPRRLLDNVEEAKIPVSIDNFMDEVKKTRFV